MGIQPFVMIREWWSKTFQRISSIPFLFILIAIEIYFLVNGSAHFEGWDSRISTPGSEGQIIFFYVIMTIMFVLWAKRGTQESLGRPLKDSMLVFTMFFIFTYIILLFLSYLNFINTGESISPGMFWPTVIMQVCVVAVAEELMFRGVLLEWTGIWISSILFAVWHSYAYGITWYNMTIESWGPIFFAFFMGVILALIVRQKRFGLPAAIAVHACYNLFVLGVFVSF